VQGGAIEIDEVPFSLLYSEKINPRAPLVYYEFGAPPSGQQPRRAIFTVVCIHIRKLVLRRSP
jgi:hypothetical protein